MPKKPTAKQLAARRKFARMAKDGTLKRLRKKKSSGANNRSSRRENARLRRAQEQGVGFIDRPMRDIEKLLSAFDNPNIKEIVIKK